MLFDPVMFFGRVMLFEKVGSLHLCAPHVQCFKDGPGTQLLEKLAADLANQGGLILSVKTIKSFDVQVSQ